MKKVLLFLLMGLMTVAFAQIGKVTGIKGKATIERAGKTIVVVNSMEIEKNDIIKTLGSGRVKLTFNDNTVISLGKEAVFSIPEYININKKRSPRASFNIVQGAFKAITGKIGKVAPKKFLVKTRNSTIGVRGTIFLGRIYKQGNKEDIACIQGGITVTSGNKVLDIDAGNYVKIENGQLGEVKQLDSEVKNNIEEDVSIADDGEKEKSDATDKKDNSKEEDKLNSDSDKDTKETSSQNSDTPVSDDSSNSTNDSLTSWSSSEIDNTSKTANDTTTDATSSATTDTTITVANSATSLSGYQNTAYKPGGTDNFIATGATSFKYDPATSTYTAQNYSLTKNYEGGNTGTTTVSASFTHTPASFVKKGGYTGHSAIADTLTIPFTTQSGASDSVKYSLEMDNMGEFLVGYKDGSVSGKTAKNLFYAGSQSDATGLDSATVYVYDDFKGTQLVMSGATSAANTVGEIKFDSTLSKKIYLNGKLRNIVIEDYIDDADGAREFMSMYVNDDGSISGKRYYKHNDTTSGAYTATSVGSVTHGALYGTDFQGAGVSFTDKEYSGYGVNNTLLNTDYNEHTVFRSSTEALASSKVSTQTMKGYVGYGLADAGSVAGITNYNASGLAVTINSSTGAVSGSISGTDVKFSVDGSINNQTSYYLNDDVFGAMLKNNTGEVTDGGTTYSYINNSGWLVSRGDKYNAASQTFIADNSDYSSWGYWTGDFKDSSSNVKNVDIHSTWVAGIETNAASISDLISKAGSSNPVYKGHVLGFVTNGTSINSIKLDSTNKFNVAFDLAAGTPTATVNNFEFTDSAANFHKLAGSGTTLPSPVEIKNITASGFDIMVVTAQKGKGTFYGPNAQSIGGSFSGIQDRVNSTNYTTTGVIKATKQ